MANGLPPGLAGYVAYNQLADQREANQMGMLSRLIGLQQAQRAQQMQEAQFRESQELAPLRRRQIESQIAATEGEALRKNQRMQAQGALSNLLMTGGYAPTTGAAAPDAVAMNEQDALRQVMEATAQGRPMTVDVPNPQRVQALATMAAPEQAMTAMLRNIYPEQPKPAAPSALSRLMAERDALPPNDPRRQVYDAAISRQTAPAAAPSVTVNMGGGNKRYAETVGGKTAERDIAQHDTALAAVDNITKLNSVIRHLETSDAITGPAAEILLNLQRATQLIRRDVAAGKKVSDTELLDSMLGSDVFPMIKALGIGARGMDTPAEREFLRSVMTGTINLNKDTLIKMAKIRRDISARAAQQWNERVRRGELDKYFDATEAPKQTIPIPEMPNVGMGATPAAGSPSTGIRFLGFE